MNTYGILQLPEPVLRTKCVPVSLFNAKIEQLCTNLVKAAKLPGRVGVAAPQIGVSLRVFAAAIGDSPCRVFVNPKIKAREGSQTVNEGCLSMKDRWFDLERSEWILIEAQDEIGNPFEIDAHGHGAQALQHEIDHLDGILVKDRVSEQLPLMPRAQRRRMQVVLTKIK